MKKIATLLIFLLLISTTYAASVFITPEAEQIYTSNKLRINLTILGGNDASSEIKDVETILNYYPIETPTQKIIQETSSPQAIKNDTSLIFSWEKGKNTSFEFSSIIESNGEQSRLVKPVAFPIENLPADVYEYTQFTTQIDSSDTIRQVASQIASGKDDAFDVAESVAFWIYQNVEYDLSSLNEDAKKKASEIIVEKRGVCNEISILFISMMRSLGLPARYVSGISYTNSELFDLPWNPHAWTEVYFPEYGWVPFDLTYMQFGYIDASHIVFKQTADVGTLQTGSTWKFLGNPDVNIRDTEFNVSVISAEGKTEEPFTITAIPAYSNVDLGSYNALKITVTNNADHYIASVLYLGNPKEVIMESKTMLPIFVKPLQSKTYVIILKVKDGLDAGYAYTMPLSIVTSKGTEYSTSFTVQTGFEYKSRDVVELVKSSYEEQKKVERKIDISCMYSPQRPYVQENITVTCTIQNLGNTFLDNANVCINTMCEKKSIPLSSSTTITRNITTTIAETKTFTITVTHNNETEEKQTSVLVEDYPYAEAAFSSIETNGNVSITIETKKTSQSDPVDGKLIVETPAGRREWNVSLQKKTQYKLELASYEFNEGDNTISARLTWKDRNGKEYVSETTSTVAIPKRGFFERLAVWFKRLF